MADTTDAIDLEFNRFRGKVCGLVESWGIDDGTDEGRKRERAMIQLVKSLSYDAQKVVKELAQ